jgi:dTDP-4-dehydrorhamnose 3,5-epimerase
MIVRETKLKDALIIEPPVFKDKRGYFSESFNYKKLNEHIGHFDIIQINKSKSKYGVLRGLHFQKPPFNQAKIVEVLKGIVIDVIVDIRTDSPTFGQHQSFVLDDIEMQQLYIPRGFAHGFVVLSRNAIFQYKVDKEYAPEFDTGIRFDDPELNIDWEVQKPIISEKDKNLKWFKEQIFYQKSDYWL